MKGFFFDNFFTFTDANNYVALSNFQNKHEIQKNFTKIIW